MTFFETLRWLTINFSLLIVWFNLYSLFNIKKSTTYRILVNKSLLDGKIDDRDFGFRAVIDLIILIYCVFGIILFSLNGFDFIPYLLMFAL